jgi:ElaB/YqjD/DUF883 family membrane-anchored ribosome-binding protein
LGDTLEALQRKLSPGEFFDQALGYVRSSGSSEFVSNLKYTFEQNPVPMGLVGIGLAWLMMSGRSGSVQSDQVYGGESAGRRLGHMASDVHARTRDAATRAREGMGRARESMTRASETAREVMGRASETARESMARAREGIERVASTSRERIHQLSHSAREGVSRVSSLSREGATRAKSGFEHLVDEQPLVLGAIGLALGAVLAASLPRTRREDEVMGETRDELLQQARAKGEEQMEKARQVATTAGSAARDAAKEAAREEAKRQNLSPETSSDRGSQGEEASTTAPPDTPDSPVLTNPPRQWK